MWRVLKNEIQYQKIGFLVYSSFLLLIVLLEIERAKMLFGEHRFLSASTLVFLKFWVCFMIMQRWTINVNQEKREHIFRILPVPLYQMALLRLVMMVVIGILMAGITYLTYALFNSFELFRIRSVIISVSALLFMYSAYFIFRDLLLAFFRRIGWTRQRLMPIIFLLLFGLNLLGLILMIQAKQQKGFLLPLGRMIDFVIQHNPFVGEYGLERFVGLTLIFVALSVVTFCRKQSVEK